MVRSKNQTMRFNDEELALFKALFADNEDLLFVVRKVMLQVKLNADENKLLSALVSNPQAYDLIVKAFLPTVDGDAPLFQLTDMYMGLMPDLKDKTVDESWPFIKAKELEIDYIKQQLAVLKDPNLDYIQKIRLSDLTDVANLPNSEKENAFISITARNYLLSYIDSNILQMKIMANKKGTETGEQTLERLKKESSK